MQRPHIQSAIAELLSQLGYRVNVNKADRRLGRVLGREKARQLRQWCGGYVGARGKQHRGRTPRDPALVREVFERLIRHAPPATQPDRLEELKRLCQLYGAPRSPPRYDLVEMTDAEAIVRTLGSFIDPRRACGSEVGLDVVTSAVDRHATVVRCMEPMLLRLTEVRSSVKDIVVRVIEQGARIPLQPDNDSWPGLCAQVCSAATADVLSWHGSLVSRVIDGARVPYGCIIGWEGYYYVRELPSSDPNVERELAEKIADFERAWTFLMKERKPRVWGLKSVS